MKYKMTVEFDFPYEIRGSTQEFKDYIADAIEIWGGQRHPDDWLFYTIKQVRVGAITPKGNFK